MNLRSASTTGHEPVDDLIGCPVRTRVDDRTVGRVVDLMMDESGSIRYLDVELDEDGSHVLLPAGNTRLAPEADIVWVYGMTAPAIAGVPTYEGDAQDVDREYERRLTGAYEDAYVEDRYYDRPEYESSTWNTGRAPTREEGEETGRREGRLERLDKLDDYEVAEHEYDPTGWDVIGRDGVEIGEVEVLIGDTGTMKVRYLVVDLHDDILEEDREILVPVGHVHLEPEHRQVLVDALSRDNVGTLPAYTGQAIDRELERDLHSAFNRTYEGDRYYGHPRYRDAGLLRSRRTRTERGAEGVRHPS